MKFTETKLKGVWIIEPKIHRDARGFFMESYNRRVFEENGLREVFVGDHAVLAGEAVDVLLKGVLRGLQYQLNPHAQGKLVSVTFGAVFDVAVDLRRASPTFGQWVGYTLSGEDRRALYIPPGFAHGFYVLTPEAEFSYKCTALYNPAAERGLRWDDPQVAIAWPGKPDPALMSEKDRKFPFLAQAETNF